MKARIIEQKYGDGEIVYIVQYKYSWWFPWETKNVTDNLDCPMMYKTISDAKEEIHEKTREYMETVNKYTKIKKRVIKLYDTNNNNSI